MKIVIAGAAGMVGQYLANHYRARGDEVTALTHRDLDITDLGHVDSRIRKERPDAIFNCAVLGVDRSEVDPRLATLINVTGPANLAKAASAIDAELIHFSSNYVFDGNRDTGAYTIDDEPRPINVYGRTKLDGERRALDDWTKTYVIRTSWVFGLGKRCFLNSVGPALKAGEIVRAIDDLYAIPTYVFDLVWRTAEIVERRRNGTYHVTNSGVCSYAEFARECASILQMGDDRVQPVGRNDVAAKAPRPVYTPMECKLSSEIGLGPLRSWKDALREFLLKA